MNQYLFFLFIFNIIINSLLAFLTAWLLIEGLMRICRVTHPRLQAYFKLIPVLKMPLVILFLNWSNWAMLQNIFPWECPEGSRIISISIGCFSSWRDLLFLPFSFKIGFHVAEGFSFSLADVLAHLIGARFLLSICIGFVVFTIFKLLKAAIDVFHQFQYRKTLLRNCRPVKQNPISLKWQTVSIFEHPDFQGSPFILGVFKPKIIFPKSIDFSSEEYAAVVAHEIEHAKQLDPLLRALIHLISSLFWWIPMKWLIHSIKEKQELACDLAATNYLSAVPLASALVKVAKQTQNNTPSLGITLLKQGTLKKRIAFLLSSPVRKKITPLQGLSLFLITLVSLLILFGKLWSL